MLRSSDNNGELQWCLPKTKDMEDEDMDDDELDALSEQEYKDYVNGQTNLWCDDLCVKAIKSKEKEMMIIGLHADSSYMCSMAKCSAEFINQVTQSIEKEETVESTYCDSVRLA